MSENTTSSQSFPGGEFPLSEGASIPFGVKPAFTYSLFKGDAGIFSIQGHIAPPVVSNETVSPTGTGSDEDANMTPPCEAASWEYPQQEMSDDTAEDSSSENGENPDQAAFDLKMNCDVTKKVRTQYEKLPYPFRDPEEDRKRLVMPMLDDLMVVNHRCFNGKKDFHNEFRALVAGGGTGDASTYLAVQMARLPGAKVIYVDLSTESMKIAKQRVRHQARRFQIPNIEKIVEFHQMSLLDVGKLDSGPFDYVNCSGVLHHLRDPSEGLFALKNVLKPDGAMSIMVYGQVGRTTIYQVQELMRIVNKNVDDMDQKIRNTNLLLSYLPRTNLHARCGRWGANESNPVEIYDLFLHSQDRAYTVGQLYDWVEGNGLHLLRFSSGQFSFLDPQYYPQQVSRLVRERLLEMSTREQQEFSEYFFGQINKYEFYVTPTPDTTATLNDDDMIPSFSLLAKTRKLPELLKHPESSVAQFQIPNHLGGITLSVGVSQFAKKVFHKIDEYKTVEEISEEIAQHYPNMPLEEVRSEVKNCLGKLETYDMINLRHKSCRCKLLARSF